MKPTGEVFISEMAQLSSLGDDLEGFWSELKDGNSGAKYIPTGFSDEQRFPVQFAHFIKSARLALPGLEENLFLSENILLANDLIGTVGARLDGLEVDGLVWGHGQAGFKFGNLLSQGSEVLTAQTWRRELAAILAERGIRLSDESSIVGHANACITGITALAEAHARIARGEWRRALVLVQEMRCRDWVLWPYYKLGLLANTGEIPAAAMRPFALDRDGFVKGEGGAAFLLESSEAMRESEGTPYCRIASAAFAADGWKMFEPREDLSRSSKCIQSALQAAGLKSSDIDYVNLYGSASQKGDEMETRLIKEVFAERAKALPLSSIKPQVGHLNTAAAAIETLATILMIHHQTVTPTINLLHPDPFCDLDYVPFSARKVKIKYALKLAFGFGWSNAALILAKP